MKKSKHDSGNYQICPSFDPLERGKVNLHGSSIVYRHIEGEGGSAESDVRL